MIDGHEESCRAQARRQMRLEQEQQQQQPNHQNQKSPQQQQQEYSDTAPLRPNEERSSYGGAAAASTTPAAKNQQQQHHHQDIADDDPEHQCVVCLDNRKVVAILPCAHLCVCYECSKMVDACPLCRGAKEALLVINEKVGKCRVCRQSVAPVYLDSHQEVCRLRMRELRRKLREEQQQSDANFLRAQSSENVHHVDDNNNDAAAHTQEGMCLNCLVKKREKFLLPCAHPLCDDCAEKATHCPICLKKIANRITVYD
jgi:hypothetical protein